MLSCNVHSLERGEAVTAVEQGREQSRYDIFISHSKADKATADAVCAALEARRIRCWIAPRDIAPGNEWSGAIVEALGNCRALVLIFSANANQSPQIRNEIVQAAHLALPILPFRIEDATPTKSLAYFIDGVHWLDALTPPLEAHIETLVATAQRLLNDAAAPSTAKPTSSPADGAPPAPARSRVGALRFDRRFVVAASTALAVAAAGGGAYLLSLPPRAGSVRTVAAFSLPGEQDLARIRDVAARNGMTLPELAFKPPPGNVDPLALRFVGVWASEIGYNGVGRQAMLIVDSASEDGRAQGYILGGRAVETSFDAVGAYTLPFVAEIPGGALEIKPEHARITYVARFNPSGDALILSANRPDGKSATVVLKPLWRAAN
jgi:hypothetical protein